eukprot:11036302-Karenia_brevis.AAC.1
MPTFSKLLLAMKVSAKALRLFKCPPSIVAMTMRVELSGCGVGNEQLGRGLRRAIWHGLNDWAATS